MSKPTELISLNKDTADEPQYAVCYARGSVFRKEGHFFRVEKAKRTIVLRALCLSLYYGKKCLECPNSKFSVTFQVRSGNGST